MLTWTTYGTWLQGDTRGWVKDGKIFQPEPYLENINRSQLKFPAINLTGEQRMISLQMIKNEAMSLGQNVIALTVCDNHVHLLVNNIELSIGRVVSHYKNSVIVELRKKGFKKKLWTKGFDKRFCINDREISEKKMYIAGHEKNGFETYIP